MSYTKTNWQTGDVISAEKLNNIENGIENASDFLFEFEYTSTSETTEVTQLTNYSFSDIKWMFNSRSIKPKAILWWGGANPGMAWAYAIREVRGSMGAYEGLTFYFQKPNDDNTTSYFMFNWSDSGIVIPVS